MPPVLSFLFLLFITVVASEIMPSRMEIARRYYANHYWRSFWTGIVACLLLTTLARALFVSEIGEPLAIGSLAVLQFFVLIGVAISSTLIGQTIVSVVSPKRAPAVKRQWFARLAAPLVGSLLLALLLVIPPLGILPRIGIRLIMLLSFLGMGAWFRTGMGTKELGGSSET
jgi:cytochrome b561